MRDDLPNATTHQRLLTPTAITAWLDCEHSLVLQHQLDTGALQVQGHSFGNFAQMLFDKGKQHEAACLEQFRSDGKSVHTIAGNPNLTFEEWVDSLGDPFATDVDALYQLPLVHDGIRGIADFVIRVVDDDSGAVSWEPVDAKLARVEAAPAHVLQLCFYAEAIAARTGVLPANLHLWLGSGETVSVRTDEVLPYWRRLRSQLVTLSQIDVTELNTAPVPCSHCEFCTFAEVCEQQWRDQDSLVHVAGLRSAERDALDASAIDTIAALASSDPDSAVDGLRPERLTRVIEQARLQVDARTRPDEPPPFHVIAPSDDGPWGHGFELLPEPDPGDVILDFEGHPFWQPSGDLFFLFGWLEQTADGAWVYQQRWAHDRDEEAVATRDLIEYLAARRADFPGMHVYHYNHTERSSLVRLSERYGVAQATLQQLIETGAFIDLMAVATNAVQVGTEFYGLKHLERLTGFVREHEIGAGAGAVVEYERWMVDGDPAGLTRIAEYNEDDVRATLALRGWLIEQRPDDLPWRDAVLLVDEPIENYDEQIAALHEFDQGTPEHLLGDLLGYWPREGSTHKAQTLARLDADDLFLEPTVITGLVPGQVRERVDKRNGKPITPALDFTLPHQEIATKLRAGAKVMFPSLDGLTGYSGVVDLDLDAGTVSLTWSERCDEHGVVPTSVVLNDWVDPKPKPAALSEFAAEVLEPSDPPRFRAANALLRRELPRFVDGGGPAGGHFDEDLDAMRAWVRELDHSCVAIQGPPGTGKTFRGAHLVHSLITSGRRVGITAFSHAAIGNLLAAVVERFEAEGDLEQLRAVCKGSKPSDPLTNVKYVRENPQAAKPEFNLVAGTSWLFANEVLREAPVDVLIIDEAGQLGLADAVAAATSAHNVVLLGDPLQLPQVALASHPSGSGASVLEHLLGEDRTMPADRGVFLSETRRMHPDVCSFISETIYEGRLTSYADCERQATGLGTGVRWLRAEHDGCTTSSLVEAELVAEEVERLVGTTWTDGSGRIAPITPSDVMVVAPYNDQVDLLRAVLDAQPATRGTPVGTVDKFQGQEAVAVLYSMATSSTADAPRGSEFLFSRNRLNVAVSRARCLAYVVCTETLVNSRASTVDQMRLLSALCSFVEHAESTTEPDDS